MCSVHSSHVLFIFEFYKLCVLNHAAHKYTRNQELVLLPRSHEERIWQELGSAIQLRMRQTKLVSTIVFLFFNEHSTMFRSQLGVGRWQLELDLLTTRSSLIISFAILAGKTSITTAFQEGGIMVGSRRPITLMSRELWF